MGINFKDNIERVLYINHFMWFFIGIVGSYVQVWYRNANVGKRFGKRIFF